MCSERKPVKNRKILEIEINAQKYVLGVVLGVESKNDLKTALIRRVTRFQKRFSSKNTD